MLFKSRVDLRVNLCLWCQTGVKIKNQQNQVEIVLTMVAYDLMYTVMQPWFSALIGRLRDRELRPRLTWKLDQACQWTGLIHFYVFL